MAETELDLDEQDLAQAAEVLGTTTPEETVNAALRAVAAEYSRELAMEVRTAEPRPEA
ncbi:type II toxin-antitoxin system VapB family antitoxin [Streptomyces spororaveus]|uniref:type II toxin-antitoxin system VapB family antitoxin n=1 Tax=Streptomyces spororaveus TaxID=284039 RepID=UPI0036BD6621